MVQCAKPCSSECARVCALQQSEIWPVEVAGLASEVCMAFAFPVQRSSGPVAPGGQFRSLCSMASCADSALSCSVVF